MTKHLRYIHTSITYESGWLWIGAAYCLNFKHPMNPGQLRVFTVFLGKLSQRRVVWSCVQVANLRQEKSANVQGLSQTAGPNRYHQRRAPVARRSNLLPMQARRENIISWIQDWSEYEDFWLCFGSPQSNLFVLLSLTWFPLFSVNIS